MKWLKYSQYLYVVVAIACLIIVIYRISTKQDYGIQLIGGIGFITMFLIRRNFLKKMNNNQKNQ